MINGGGRRLSTLTGDWNHLESYEKRQRWTSPPGFRFNWSGIKTRHWGFRKAFRVTQCVAKVKNLWQESLRTFERLRLVGFRKGFLSGSIWERGLNKWVWGAKQQGMMGIKERNGGTGWVEISQRGGKQEGGFREQWERWADYQCQRGVAGSWEPWAGVGRTWPLLDSSVF